jgi:F-type H+-transporting ATPase subunit c
MSRTNGLFALSGLLILVVLLPTTTAWAQGAEAATNSSDVAMWIACAAAFGMAIASAVCGTAQGRAVASACEGMARNPSAGGQIRGSLIIGLVLIESLAIYTLLIGLVLIFLRWPA